MMDVQGQPIGCNEFARIIGADHSDVSREAKRGLLCVLSPADGKRGPGSTMLDGDHAARIAGAVECGIPWRVAASLGGRLCLCADGVFIRREIAQ